MKKRVNIITVVVLMALMALVTYVITFSWAQSRLNNQLETYSRQRQELAAFYAALDRIENSFIGETDKQSMMEGAIEGLVKSLGDQWSHYWNPDDYRSYLESQSRSYEGIGVTVDSHDDGILIVEVMSGSPSEGAGLLAGDIITHVDGVSVVEAGYSASVNAVKGDEYTTVELTVARPSDGGGSFTVSVMRQTLLREIVSKRIFDDIGYIKILSFDENVEKDFIAAVDSLIEADVKGIVFDVRNNPGGKLNALEAMLNYLLPEGDLITLRYKDGREDVRRSGSECVEVPMAVLINGDSISAAEFFAACLSEYEWATLVGENTHGKGYAQEHFRLSDGSGLYLSTSEYFTSKGISLAGVGLTPDVEVSLTDDERRSVGSMDLTLDKQLARAIELLS